MRAFLSRAETEMAFGFSVSGASEEKDSLSSGCELGELIKSEGGSLGLLDSGFGVGGELESADPESLGDVEESDIVGDGADDGHDFGIVFSLSSGDGSFVFSEVFDDA